MSEYSPKRGVVASVCDVMCCALVCVSFLSGAVIIGAGFMISSNEDLRGAVAHSIEHQFAGGVGPAAKGAEVSGWQDVNPPPPPIK